ncbi:DUF4955 domain-containing protein [Tamlana sp. 2201CG12-4]|uniref:DUF4955 domain-containing protein n=1 Tax=Tamlana sp. 2201CG12-4 TaxID=3112582 RepID=UPI002DBF91CD|nr:DUF4955 domain-containing protein [Tamlana sp. 2201CG12-4]MEC3908840.1 DUF4955 domain-containing protein [Tamlana sp. 2201CG12-4]
MMCNKFVLGVFSIVILSCGAQQSKVWENYKESKKMGKEAMLPDFSYAGYKYSEEAIPKVNYKVFNVIDFGAKVNDDKSDKNAVKKAIEAAMVNGEGIIFFPRGKYIINTGNDDLTPILITSSKIVLRGEGTEENGTTIFFDKDLPPKNPNQLWSTPKAIKATSTKSNKFLANIIANTKRETYSVKVSDPSKIKRGDWVILEVKNNSKDLIEYDLQPIKPAPEWTSILEKGVVVNERHQVASVNGNTVTFFEPIHYDIQKKHGWKLSRFAHIDHIGFESIVFEGNWLKEFKHHRSAQDDGGWSILSISKAVNSWIKDCKFKNVNNAANFSLSAACTAINIEIEGNRGHASISAAGGSTGILLAKIEDTAGMHHAVGVGGGSTTGTVIWKCKYPANTSFESHASQPRCTLFDNIEGGFFLGRAGGARQNLPNHGRYLVLWNYNEIDEAEVNFDFQSKRTWYWQMVPPIIVGFHGAGTTFNEKEVQVNESHGVPVKPESLFEEQLKLRLGKLPNWMLEMD